MALWAFSSARACSERTHRVHADVLVVNGDYTTIAIDHVHAPTNGSAGPPHRVPRTQGVFVSLDRRCGTAHSWYVGERHLRLLIDTYSLLSSATNRRVPQRDSGTCLGCTRRSRGRKWAEETSSKSIEVSSSSLIVCASMPTPFVSDGMPTLEGHRPSKGITESLSTSRASPSARDAKRTWARSRRSRLSGSTVLA